jgi:hypothetical protein
MTWEDDYERARGKKKKVMTHLKKLHLQYPRKTKIKQSSVMISGEPAEI